MLRYMYFLKKGDKPVGLWQKQLVFVWTACWKNTHRHTHTHAGLKHTLPTSWLSSTIECVVWCYHLFRSRLKSAETWADGQVKALVWLTTGAARTPASGEGSLPRCSAPKTSCEACGWKPIRSFRLSRAEPEERGKERRKTKAAELHFFFWWGEIFSRWHWGVPLKYETAISSFQRCVNIVIPVCSVFSFALLNINGSNTSTERILWPISEKVNKGILWLILVRIKFCCLWIVSTRLFVYPANIPLSDEEDRCYSKDSRG